MNGRKVARYILKGGYYGGAFIIPIIAALSRFPIWKESPVKCVSGVSVAVLIIATAALRNKIKAAFKTPVPFMGYGVALAICLAIRSIVDELTFVLVISLLSSVIAEGMKLTGEALEDEKGIEKDGTDS